MGVCIKSPLVVYVSVCICVLCHPLINMVIIPKEEAYKYYDPLSPLITAIYSFYITARQKNSAEVLSRLKKHTHNIKRQGILSHTAYMACYN